MSDSLSPTQDDLNRMAAELGAPRPSFGEGMAAAFREGFEGSLPGAVATIGREVQGARRDPTPMGKEEYGASGLQRRGLAWDEGMTRGRAEAMAQTWDERQQRQRVMHARDPSMLETGFQFGAQLGGNLFDPANLLPFVGATSYALRGARNLTAGAAMLSESATVARASGVLGRAAGVLEARGVGAGIARGVTDATLGNIATMPLIYGVAARYGEDVTFGTVMLDLSIGAIIGAGFGAAAGALGRGSDPRTAVRVLDSVAADVASGRPAEVPMPLVRASVEDAVMRSAPMEMHGVRLADLPMAPAGLPVSRAEFESWADVRGWSPGASLRRDLMGSAARIEIGPGGQPRAAEQGPVFDPTAPVEPEPPRAPTRAEVVRAPVLGSDGTPLIAFSRHEAKAMEARLRKAGETEIEWVRLEGEPGSYAVAGVSGASVYRGKDGEARVYHSAARAKTAASQIAGKGWVPLEVEGGFVLMRADGAMGQRLQTNRSLVEIGADFMAAPRRPEATPIDPMIALADAMKADAYQWYREALDARHHVDRLAAAPAPRPVADLATPAREAETTGATAADPDLQTAMRQIDAMRAEGLINAADEAILRAGAEHADELDATAKGMEEAGECLLRNLA